jgi:hypothetical protein
MNKKGQKQGDLVWVVLAVVAIYLVSTGAISFGGGTTTPTTTTDGATQVGACTLLNAPTISPNYRNAYTFAAVTPVTHNWVQVDGAKVDDGAGAFNSVVGQPYRVLSNASQGGFYNAWTTGTTDCQADKPVDVNLYSNASATLTFYNADDQPSTAQAIGTQDSKTYKFKISAPKSTCFGNPQAASLDASAGLIVGFDYNTSLYQKVSVDKVLSVTSGVTGAAGDAVKVSVPQQYVGTLEEAYKLPVSAVCDLGEMRGIGTIESKASQNPGASDDPTMRVLDTDIFQQIRSDSVVAGTEDTDGTDKGYQNPTLTVDVS